MPPRRCIPAPLQLKNGLFSIRSFGRKLLLFVIVDIALTSVQAVWQKQTRARVFLLTAVPLPYSVLLAALFNAIDRK